MTCTPRRFLHVVILNRSEATARSDLPLGASIPRHETSRSCQRRAGEGRSDTGAVAAHLAVTLGAWRQRIGATFRAGLPWLLGCRLSLPTARRGSMRSVLRQLSPTPFL